MLIRAIRSQVFHVEKTHAIGHLTGMEMITGEKGDERFIQTLAVERQFDVIIDMIFTTEHLEYDPKITTEQDLIKSLQWCIENGMI